MTHYLLRDYGDYCAQTGVILYTALVILFTFTAFGYY